MFLYALTVALNIEEIESHLERISNIEPFINQYNREEKTGKDWKKFESSNKTVALNILYVPYNTKEIKHAYVSKHKFKCKNQAVLLMITDGKKRHYLTVKKLSGLLRGIASNHNEDLYRFKCFN